MTEAATPERSERRERIRAALRPPRVLEYAVAVIMVLTVIADVPTSLVGPNPVPRLLVLAVTVGGFALAWRRPWPGLIVMVAGPLLTIPLGVAPLPVWSTVIFAAFALALRGMPALPVGLLVGAVDYVVVAVGEGQGPWNYLASIAGVLAIASAAIGAAIRGNHRYRHQLETSAREALATREAEAERRVAEERVRIARDLHDVVGHEIALIGMHLGAAEIHLPGGPVSDDARTDLAAARRGVQAVLKETQQILSVLRVGSAEQSTDPVADFSRVADLIASYRAGGLRIEESVAAASVALPMEASVAAYRVVQEALTNAQRHGAGAVTLRVDREEDVVVIEAVNVKAAGGRAGGAGSGYGLVGMRERIDSVGGTLAIRDEEKLFWLRASLPVTERTSA